MATKAPAIAAPEYDLEEAHELVADLSERLGPDITARTDAAQRLLDALPTLSRPGVTFHKKTDRDEGQTSKAGTWAMANDKKRFLVAGKDGNIYAQKEAHSAKDDEALTDLRYNPITKLLEGVEVDSRYVPANGTRRVRQRSAAAVLIEQVTKMLLRPGNG